MVEPVSLAILLSGFGGLLWKTGGKLLLGDGDGDGLVQQALSGVVGNEAHDKLRIAGRAVRRRLLKQRGRLGQNHDIAKALRRAQLTAMAHVVETWARTVERAPNPPKRFIAAFRAAHLKAEEAVETLTWDTATEDAMFAAYQQAFRDPQDADDPDALMIRLDEQVVDQAWKELLAWADGAHIPDAVKQRFDGARDGVLGFLAAWRGEVVVQIKQTPEFQTAFFTGKLMDIGDLAVEGQAALERLEAATADVRAELAAGFAGVHDHLTEMEARLAAQITAALTARETGEVATDDAAEDRRAEAAHEMVQGDADEQAAARLIAEGRVEEGFARLRADAESGEAAADQANKDAAAKWRRLGDLAYGVSVTEALNAYQKAAERDPGDFWTHVLLGRLHTAAGDLAAARLAAEAALAAAGNDRERSVAHDAVGDVARAQGDQGAARAAFTAGLDIAQSLSDRDPSNTTWLHDLSVSHHKFGDLALAEGDLTAARIAFAADLEISQRLSDSDPFNNTWLRDLSVSHDRLGNVAMAQRDLAAARTAYAAGLDIRQRLSDRDPSNTTWLRDLAVSHNKLGDVASAEGDLATARPTYTVGLQIVQRLSERDPSNTEWQRDLSISHNKLGDVARAECDLAAARAAYAVGLQIAQRLSDRDPSNAGWLRDLAVSHAKLAQVAEAAGDRAAAAQGYRQAEAGFRSVLTLSPTHAETRRMADLARVDAERMEDHGLG